MKFKDYKFAVAMYLALATSLLVVSQDTYVITIVAAITFYCLMIFTRGPMRRCKDCGHAFHLNPLTFIAIRVTQLTCLRCNGKVKNKHQ